jgi:hypothetical protein
MPILFTITLTLRKIDIEVHIFAVRVVHVGGTGIFKQVKHVRMNGQLNAMLANVFMNGLVANVVKNE